MDRPSGSTQVCKPNVRSIDDPAFLQNLILLTPGSLYWKDKEGRYLGCNLFMAKAANLKSIDDIIGKTDFDLWPDNAKRIRDNDLEVMRTGKTASLEETVKIHDGTTFYFASVKMPLKNKDGEIIGVICNSLDITPLKTAEQSLKTEKEKAEKATKAAEKANQLKTIFIRNMEHDLRTPFNGLWGIARVLAQNEIDSAKKVKLDMVSHSAKQLLDLCNEILDFAQIESGNIPVLSNSFNLYTLIKNIMAIEKPPASLKQLDFLLSYDKTLPRTITGDDYRLRRILMNLIGNAIKFTNQGFIKLEISPVKTEKETVFIRFAVKDTGIGIPKEKQDIIYDTFSTVTPSNKGLYKGSGLGLQIVKQFVEQLNGKVYMDSCVNKGSTFTFIIPFKVSTLTEIEKNQEELEEENICAPQQTHLSKTDTKQHLPTHLYRHLNLLLVEDDIIAQKLASMIITEHITPNIDIASTGKEALRAITQRQYDLIFMDIGLPDITGFTLTKKIKQLYKEIWAKDVPIIALTAHDAGTIKRKSFKAGMSDFLVKPLTIEKIKTVLNKTAFPKKITEP